MRIPALLVLLSSLSSGCLAQIIPEHEHAGETDAALQSMLASGSFRTAGFARINQAPFESGLVPDQMVSMFVSTDAAAAYQAVSPDSNQAGAPFPVGGVIVRAATDTHGGFAALTMMVKRESGYYPESGDFMFAVTDAQGKPVTGDDGVEWGPLKSCGSCHHARASSGYLFGVATADR
jgi:hypothetical protein